MSSAFGEPPDSGVSRSAEATGARSSAPVTTARRVRASRREVMRLRRREVSKAAGILFTNGCPTAARCPPAGAPGLGSGPYWCSGLAGGRSAAGETSRSLLQEGRDALDEVIRMRHLALNLGFELQLGVHARVEPGVQLALGARVGRGGAGGQAVDERVDLG